MRLATDGSAGYVRLRSAAAYDLRGDAVTVELEAPPGPGVEAFLTLRYDGGSYLETSLLDGVLTNRAAAGGAAEGHEGAFALAAQRFWRIREEGGEVRFEASPDGRRWSETYRTGHLPPLDELSVELGLGAGVPAAAQEARFAAVNVAPP